jgi:hypothetical protein
MLSARGEEGEKSDSFSRGNEQDRSPLWKSTYKVVLENVPVEHFQRNPYNAPIQHRHLWKKILAQSGFMWYTSGIDSCVVSHEKEVLVWFVPSAAL